MKSWDRCSTGQPEAHGQVVTVLWRTMLISLKVLSLFILFCESEFGILGFELKIYLLRYFRDEEVWFQYFIITIVALFYITIVVCVSKECTNTPSKLPSHTFRNELLQSNNESFKAEYGPVNLQKDESKPCNRGAKKP
ncbi:hypothetical protein YC2023_123887 [Brassica napus]